MIGIFQVIGNPKMYHEVKFIIGDKSYRAKVSGRAVNLWLGEKSELFILAPESVDKSVAEKFSKENEATLLRIPAQGEYSIGNKKIVFKCNLETIITSIFWHMLKIKPREVYVDASTGLNVYVLALVEAARRYLTYANLKWIVQGKKGARVVLVSSPPITRETTESRLEMEDIDVKAFFSLPRTNPGVLFRRSENQELYNKLKEILGNLKIAYNSLRLNAPLSFYTSELLNLEERIEEVEEELMNLLQKKLQPEDFEYSDINGKGVANLFYIIAMYSSLQKFKATLKIPEVEEVRRVFSQIYTNPELGLKANKYFLERDLNNLKEISENLKEGEEITLLELVNRNRPSPEKVKGSKDQQRNFFAHSGLLYEYTLVRKHNSKLYLRWLPEGLDNIKKWLLRA